MSIRFVRPHLLSLATLLVPCGAALAQCDVVLHGDGPFAGADGPVTSFVEWDPDGAGPLGTHVVVCGEFTNIVRAGGGLALFDPATGAWSSLARVDGHVLDAAVTPAGELVVGGAFTAIDGVAAANVARFDGSSWTPLGIGIQDPAAVVRAVAVRPNGEIFFGGDFSVTLPGGAVGTSVLRFANGQMASVGNLIASLDSEVRDLAILPNGDVVATGYFSHAGGVPVASLARWDGTAWNAYGAGLRGNTLLAIGAGEQLAVTSAGDLVVVGLFDRVDGLAVANVARFDGSAWSALAGGVQGTVQSVRVAANGELIVGGSLRISPTLFTPALRFDGAWWRPLGVASFAEPARSLYELPNGHLLAGTRRGQPGDTIRGVQRFDGQSWRAVASGTDGPVLAGLALENGDAFVTGAFGRLAGSVAIEAARYVDGVWLPEALPFPGDWTSARAYRMRTGHVAVALEQGGSGVLAVRRAEQTSFAVVALVAGGVFALGEDASGRLLVGGDFTHQDPFGVVSRGLLAWDPLTSALAPVDPQFAGSITAIETVENGTLVFGGDFTQVPGPARHLATFDAQTWSAFAGDLDAPPRDLALLADGQLVALGEFSMAGGTSVPGIARFDGSAWHGLGSGITDPGQRADVLAAMPNGELLVGGDFTAIGGVPAANVARWDGTAWHAIGSGADAPVRGIDVARDGGVVCVGEFSRFDGVDTMFVARLAPSCPGDWFVYENSFCAVSGPAARLDVRSGAWLGASLRTLAVDAPLGHAALAVYGFRPIGVPLSTVLPNSPQWCYLLVDPQLLTVPSFVGSTAEALLAIPNAPVLAGAVLHHQFVTIDVATPGQLGSASATDAAALRIGSHW